MTDARMSFWLFDGDGKPIRGGTVHGPDVLDWMDIDVKAHWFRFMGQGPETAKYAVLNSQGEQRLLTDLSLSPLDYKQYRERLEASHDEIDRFIQEGGYSRKPRNQ